MTKFQNPSFNSPANNENYSNNYDKTFGKPCTKDKCRLRSYSGYKLCDKHLEEAGVVTESPETD